MAADPLNEIHADVFVGLRDPADKNRLLQDERPHKLRLTIFSGPDFRAPHINVGRVFSNRRDALAVAAQVKAACDLLCIPVGRLSGTLEAHPSILRDAPEGYGYERI